MRVLVTGGSGFVGGALCASLDGSSHSIRLALRLANAKYGTYDQVVVGQINAAANWSAALKDVEVVVHLAARVHVMDEQSADPLSEFRRVNVDGSLNLARQAASAGVKRLIYLIRQGEWRAYRARTNL